MAKKNKIQKNRDIEEMIEQAEEKETIESMKEIIAKMDKKREEFRNRLNREEETEQQEEITTKLKNVYARKDAQEADKKRRIELLKAIDKVEKEQEER